MKFFKYIIIVLICAKVETILTYEDSRQHAKALYLEQNSILYVLSNFAENLQLNANCSQQLQHLKAQSLKKTAWALKMLDASARFLPGFMFGQNYWLGDQQICRAAQHAVPLAITAQHEHDMHWEILKQTAPFDVGFSVAYIQHTSPWQVQMKYLPPEGVIHVGLCVPVACQVADLQTLIEHFLNNNFDEAHDFYELNPKLFYIKRLHDNWLPNADFFQSSAFVYLASLSSITLLLMLFAAVLSGKTNKKSGGITAVIKCFDLAANISKISENTGDIPVINGLRVIVSISVVMIHVTFFAFPTITNTAMVFTLYDNNAILAAHVVVDFFFTISGFLQSYKFLNSQQQLESLKKANLFQLGKEFFKRIFHRWLRLAPLYYTIVFLSVLVLLRLNEVSVYHLVLRDDLYFPKDWWRYLLFIHNFVYALRMAATWTWSLACEMQFFIFGTLLLLLYAKKQLIAKFCFLTTLAFNTGAYYYNGIIHRFGLNLDDFLPNINVIYFNTLVRCTPYLLGIFCGWYLTEKECHLNGFTERLVGNTAFVIFILFIGLLFDINIPLGFVSTTIIMLARIAVSIWVCWLITAALTNRKTLPSLVLQLSWFRILGRLSYAFYLIHPCIIIYISHTTNAGLHLDFKLMCILHFGFVLMSYFGAIILTLAFEIPYCNLSSLILKKRVQFRGPR